MISILIAFILIILALQYNKGIRKYSIHLFIASTIIAILVAIFPKFLPFVPFQKGAVGLAFFYVVMLTGAFKHGSKLRKTLMGVRKEYSIIGFLFISPHVFVKMAGVLDGKYSLPIYGILSFVIMIPLFVLSFSVIKKKLPYKKWKNIQRFAYGSYVLLFIHLMIQAQMPNILAYIIMFFVYAVLKTIYVIQYLNRKKKPLK
jgi:DMSO/TMAO reductase YedYZ heme-binding membrane subunit